jgi:hypothetical protein
MINTCAKDNVQLLTITGQDEMYLKKVRSRCKDCGKSFDSGPLLLAQLEAFFGRGRCSDCRALSPLGWEV